MADQMTEIAPPSPDPFNIQAVKNFVFNETGNVMVASTDSKSDAIQQSVRDVFNEVSVFFAAMTKAISQTRNPKALPNQSPYYSLYNYDALEAVIDGSGYFVHVNEEDIQYHTESVGVTFSKELFEAILGLASGSGALAFASAMIASMGKEGLNIEYQNGSRTNKVANIVFVCEYLLGMPIISALVVSVDAAQAAMHLKVGPCFSTNKTRTEITAHKDTYMFVTPAFIKQYASDLNAGANDPAYMNLIMTLQSLVERTPRISGVYDVTTPAKPVQVAPGEALSPAKQYAVYGQYLGEKTTSATITLLPAATDVTVSPGLWDSAGIYFSFKNTGPEVRGAFQFLLSDGTKLTTAEFALGK